MYGVTRRIFVLCAIYFFAVATDFAQGWQHIGNVQRVTKLSDGVEVLTGKVKVRVTVFREGVFRVRVAPEGIFPKDSSWAVVEEAAAPPVNIEETADGVKLASGSTVVRIKKVPLLIDFLDSAGNVIVADEPSLPMAWDGGRIHVWKKMPADESYFGLGDKAGPMNRRNRSFTMWNTDEFGWQESSDPLYKTIPFFQGFRNGTAYGIFFDNTWRSSFDFGKESRDYYSFGADGGEINYYYFAGPDLKKIIENYTALTGRIPLPPLWALGYQQCRYSYYPEKRGYEIVERLREDKIPADTIYFDIDYQNGYAPFTVNREYFPNFEKMIADFKAVGVHTVLITDLHIKQQEQGYPPYETGMKQDVFVKRADGSLFVGPVWPGPSVFPDFTLTRVRDWWGGLYKDFVGMGVSGFWNDMNEPSVFLTPTKTMPLDNVHRTDDGAKHPHTEIHNVFGMQNVRATYDGLRKLQGDERPFVLTRAAYAGAQRYAATWTGDNSSTWNHLAMSTPQLLSMGISGYGMVGDDIGGFAGTPTADLLTRWFEVGAFNPIYRDHTAKGTGDQEPWVHGPEHEAIRRRFIEERYRLLPYIYTEIEEMSRTGIPLMRPLFLEYPRENGIVGNDHDFLFGRDLFVAPVTTEMLDAQSVHLPPGDWYDYWTAEKHNSKDEIVSHPALDQMPLYVRAGAVIPMQELVQYTGEIPPGGLKLRVYPGPDCSGSLYQDDGHTYAYQKGEILRVKYSCKMSGNELTINGKLEKNNYKPWWNSTEVRVFGAVAMPKMVKVGGTESHIWSYDEKKHSVTVAVNDALDDWTVEISY
ncbi:MAG TPA: glycoside hydrolase family 31 protein [Candidatus Dormibacteraeota bacterium]|nr:glycoside hydrolase family 31 protein [Candidatus Dormibacteraeota bacterium]